MVDLEKINESKSIKQLLEFGILNIDKSTGPTSFTVSDFIRRKLKINKTSHFGTLDPQVTGVLPIALGRACRLTGFFLGEDKEYVGIARFHEDITRERIEEMIKQKFIGKIIQLPPVKSSVKREEREREIKSFDILEKKGTDVLFIVACEGGTYIRKLIDDLGKELGIGAHMLELRRIRAGIFKEDEEKYPSVRLYDFEKAVEELEKGNEAPLRKMIIPAEIVAQVYPAVEVKIEELKRLFTGKPLYKKDLIGKVKFKKGEQISAFAKNQFIGMYSVIDGEDILGKAEFILQP